MKRASLVAVLSLFSLNLPSLARAADPPGAQADPFAPQPEPSRTEPDEEALLRGSTQPNPNPPSPPPAAAPAPGPRATARANNRRAAQASDEKVAVAAAPGADESALAVELSTSGFASGSLVGGLFVGGRTATGLILGGLLDYNLLSVTASGTGGGADVTRSGQTLRIGAGARYSFVRSADRLVDLYGAADLSFEHVAAEVAPTVGSNPTESVSASGFSLAVGPGLRFWVHPQIALGYAARLRLTYLSGVAGAFTTPETDDPTNASATAIAFDGAFQILGVF